MEILDRAKSFLSDVVEGKLAAEDAKRSALGGNVAGNSDAGVGAGIGKAGGRRQGYENNDICPRRSGSGPYLPYEEER